MSSLTRRNATVSSRCLSGERPRDLSVGLRLDPLILDQMLRPCPALFAEEGEKDQGSRGGWGKGTGMRHRSWNAQVAIATVVAGNSSTATILDIRLWHDVSRWNM